MSKRDEFIAAINILSAASQSITTEQRIGLLQQAVQEYGLSTDDADAILKASGLIVGEKINYFEVLGLSLEELQNESDDVIANSVDVAHQQSYNNSLRAGGLPRSDGRTQEQWRTLLNQARDILKDPLKRSEHIETLQTEITHHIDFMPQEENSTPVEDEIVNFGHTSLRVSVPEDMVKIPTGEFQMGSDNEKSNVRENPVHPVYVDSFYMDKYPVTNKKYQAFLNENPLWRKPSFELSFDSTKWYEWNKK